MSQKIVLIDGIGNVPFYKRRNTNSIKIKINGSSVKVSLPIWVSYKVAILYVNQRLDWIINNLKPTAVLRSGHKIGKKTILQILSSDSTRFTSKYLNEKLIIKVPNYIDPASQVAQERIKNYAIKALQRESEDALIPMIRNIAHTNNFIVNKIEVKNLRSRWGSCNNQKDIAISLFLIQLPWECIEYVIIHELVHTVHMNHSTSFWKLVEQYLPDYKQLRLKMKQYSTHIF